MFKRVSIVFLAFIFILSFSITALAAPKSGGSKASNEYKERLQVEERQKIREELEVKEESEVEDEQKEAREQQQNDEQEITEEQSNAQKEVKEKKDKEAKEEEDKQEIKQEIKKQSAPQEAGNLGNELQNQTATQENNASENTRVKVERQLKVRFRGREVKWDAPPVIKEGRTLVPVRALSEGLGADVNWDANTKTVTIAKDDTVIVLKLDSSVITVNGKEMTLDVPAQLVSNRTFVPIRFITEALNQKVIYNEESNEVDIEGEETSSVSNTTNITAETAP